jgi:hypothetical protein
MTVGLLVLGLFANIWGAVINTSAWTGLNVSGWENAMILAGPLLGLGLLVLAGYQIIGTKKREE